MAASCNEYLQAKRDTKFSPSHQTGVFHNLSSLSPKM
jgi:hypothetical protein